VRYTAASIANAFLSRAFGGSGQGLSPMKIQKLAYLAHGYYLAETGEPLLDEYFEAWRFGPVLPSLYHQCKKFGRNEIDRYIEDFDVETGRSSPAPMPDDLTVLDIVRFVWTTYGKMSAVELSDWTHAKDGPWAQTTNSGASIIRNQDIPDSDIAAYFRDHLDAQSVA
jgi:uncharacterized phage-associated protein